MLLSGVCDGCVWWFVSCGCQLRAWALFVCLYDARGPRGRAGARVVETGIFWLIFVQGVVPVWKGRANSEDKKALCLPVAKQ